jgi:PilZ domain
MRVLARDREQHELLGQTRDVSYRGLYFLSNANFEAGTEIDFVLSLPQQGTSGDVSIRCQGRIVRVEPTSNGRLGIAARIERYEFVSTASAA